MKKSLTYWYRSITIHFLEGRDILDSVLVINEVIDEVKRKRENI